MTDRSAAKERHATLSVLERLSSTADWDISVPTRGRQAGTYIARSSKLAVFVKWHVDSLLLGRLSELAIVPHILLAGSREGKSFVVQEFVAGRHPEREWFGENLNLIAGLISRYQRDWHLEQILLSKGECSAGNPVQVAVDEVMIALTSIQNALPFTSHASVISDWKEQAGSISFGDPVPIHSDPNWSNFLLTRDRVFLIDWDGARLSDPMADVGPLLWWYVPLERWHHLIQAIGMEANKENVRKVYWWAAHRSISVAVELSRQHAERDAVDKFLLDFSQASAGLPNPHS